MTITITDMNIIIGGPGGRLGIFYQEQKNDRRFHPGKQNQANSIGPISAGRARSAKALIDLGIRGGIRVHHLHFNDKIYLLDSEQWSKLSKGIIADCKAKLAKVKKSALKKA